MTKVLIIGNSAAGFSACRLLSGSSIKLELTVISKEPHPAYRRDLLIDYFSGKLQEKEIFLTGEDPNKVNPVALRENSEVVKIDTKRKTVSLKDKSKLEYDYLIIACGQKVSLPDIPGKTKEGVFGFYELSDAIRIKESLLLPHTVCVIGKSPLALRITEAIASMGKDVQLISDVELQEFIGEGAELQAIKLSNGKVIGTTLAVIAGPYVSSAAFLKEGDIANSSGYIGVDSAMRTNIENIFACGSVAVNAGLSSGQKLWQDCVNEGIMAAQSIINSIGEKSHVGSID
ncbi:MAG: FAD-dependent oxidoreductase [Candidatus Omnitrophota bacterium]